MCGIGFLASFPNANGNDSQNNDNDHNGCLPDWNRFLSESLARRGPDVPQQQYSVHGNIDEDVAEALATAAGKQWSVTLHASVLHMRGHHPVAQPASFPVQVQDGQTNCALCWNGECYTYNAMDGPVGEFTNDICEGNMVEPGVEQSDTILVTKLIQEAMDESKHSRMREHEAIAKAMGRTHGEFSFILFVPNSSSGCIYYGRDRLGRRSLLANKSSLPGVVAVSSVAVGGLDKDGIGLSNKKWEEIPPGIVYRLDLCTAEEHSLPLPRVVNRHILDTENPLLRSIEENSMEAAADTLLKLLDKAVKRRVMLAPIPKSQSATDASVAVLFSGGIDSVILAALSHRHVPSNQTIDLINVSFYKDTDIGRKDAPTSPDRLAAIISYDEMLHRFPERRWRFVAVDVPYQEVLDQERRILNLISPLDSTMDFNIANAFWFAGRGSGRLLGLSEVEELRSKQDIEGSSCKESMSVSTQEPLLRFATKETSDNCKTSQKIRPTCVRDGCTRLAPQSGCIFQACKLCCGKFQGPISSYLGRSARLCRAHNESSGKQKKSNQVKNSSTPGIGKAHTSHSHSTSKDSSSITSAAYTSNAKILLSGVGADEQMAGYGRHRTTYQRGGYDALQKELQLEVHRLWTRNLGRDDRCLSDHGKEARFPYLDEGVMLFLEQLPLEKKCDMTRPLGEGDKLILRKVARTIGVMAGGLIILAGCFVSVERVFNKNVKEDAENLTIGLLGAGRGSMYNTCSSDSKTLKKLTSVDLKQKPATDLKYNFYSIDNPKEYLSGSDAVVVEKGPYNLRKYSVAYDVAQKPSSLSVASQDIPNGALEYSTANAYLVLDQDVTATSNLQRNSDLSLAFTESKETLPVAKRMLANHLSMTDSVVNYSPDYLSLLGTMNDEVNMILSLHCTSEQIANVGVAGKNQCTDNELGDISANCACCMMDDDHTLATSRSIGPPPSDRNCNSYFDDEGPTLSRLSLLASYDGGVAIKAAGEKKYDGSGNLFTATSFGQTEIHTALIQSHTINDLMFGYPSAYLGFVALFAQMEQAKKSLTNLSNTDLAKRMLTGQMDNNLSFKLGNIAEYTSKVGSACFATCLEGGDCSGKAPDRHETSDVDKAKLGGIECKPYTSTFETVAKCTATNAALQLNPNAPEYEACVCANGSDEWSSQGCCLAAGKHEGEDLRGEGCLFEVAGIVDPNYAGMDTSVANAVDLGAAIQSWIDRETPKPSSEFMCPAPGKLIDEHFKFGHYETFDGSEEHITYYYTGNDRMHQDDVTNSASTPFKVPVTGGSGKYFVPKGLTVKVGTSQISDGYPLDIPHPVYVPSAKRPITFAFEGVREKFVRNKICGSDTCIVSARLRPLSTSFNANEQYDDGTGLPFDGLQPVGHVSGPSLTGRPEYLHQPLFFDGDEVLYTQQDNSNADRSADGNGIKIYRPKADSDPGTFDPSASESNYQLVDKAYVDSQREVLQSHIDIEVGTGLGARQRMRFGTSHSIWECDPSTNAKCKLPVNSKGANSCYTTAGSAAFAAKSVADKDDLTTLGRSNFTYPCSAANLLTPHVVGGKILPMYWYEESTIHTTAPEVDLLATYAESYSKSGANFILVFSIAFIASFFGMSMLLLCLCFEQKHLFMKAEEERLPTN